MKDALGHGSDPRGAHSDGVQQIGQKLRKGQSYAGKFSISDKDPESMTHGQLAKEYYNMTLHSSALTKEMINSGRGMERPSEIRGKADELSNRYNAVNDRVSSLRNEYEIRARNGGRRVPTPNGGVKFIGGTPDRMEMGYYEG